MHQTALGKRLLRVQFQGPSIQVFGLPGVPFLLVQIGRGTDHDDGIRIGPIQQRPEIFQGLVRLAGEHGGFPGQQERLPIRAPLQRPPGVVRLADGGRVGKPCRVQNPVLRLSMRGGKLPIKLTTEGVPSGLILLIERSHEKTVIERPDTHGRRVAIPVQVGNSGIWVGIFGILERIPRRHLVGDPRAISSIAQRLYWNWNRIGTVGSNCRLRRSF